MTYNIIFIPRKSNSILGKKFCVLVFLTTLLEGRMKFFLILCLFFPLTLFSYINERDWVEYKPEGGTSCARGGEFSFFVHEGDPNKIVIDFFGGGACWNKKTCKKGSKIFIDSMRNFRKKNKKNITGIYDKKDKKNPLLNWTHVLIPYCTGDIHIGEKDQTYWKGNKKFVINHRGATNVKAVLDFVDQKYVFPEKILMAGCSAGAYGSIYWLPHVKEMYPTSKLYQFADSGAGVITDNFFMDHAKKKWDAWKNIPSWIVNKPKNLVELYSVYGDYYPDVSLSQFSYRRDKLQKLFYLLMGGKKADWKNHIKAHINEIDSSLDNFNYYLSEGNKHCVLLYPRFYETKVDGEYLGDWLKKLVEDDTVENKMCARCN